MSVDPHAAGLYPLLDPEWRAKTRRAGWLVLLPFVGWPTVLGYRKAQIEHFFWPKETAMPEWHGRHREHCLNGFRSIAVIHVYLLPLWIGLMGIALTRGFTPGLYTGLGILLCAVLPIFCNIAFPLALAGLSLPVAGGPWLARPEALLLGVLFHLVIFLVPAGFMRVAATGRFRSAFDLGHTLPFILRRRRDYVRAWWHALWMNLPVLPAIIVAPWAIFWGFVASVALFNQLLMDEPDLWAAERERGDSWLAEATRRHRASIKVDGGTARLLAVESMELGVGERVRYVRTPWTSVPLPFADAVIE